MPAEADALAGLVEAVGPVRPGDTLVFRVAGTPSRQQFDEIVNVVGDPFKERLPDVTTLFVAGVDQILVYRPGTEALPPQVGASWGEPRH